jgi:hypothetical protein
MTKKLFLAVALSLSLLAACSKDDAEQTVKNPKLIELGTVQETNIEPGAISLIGGYERDSLEFKGNDIMKTVDVFVSREATTPVISIFYKGTYTRGNDIGSETFEIDFNFTSVEMVARNEDAVKLLNGLSFCGKNDFVIGQPANLTAGSTGATCPLDDMPKSVYDVYHVEADKVFFGRGDKSKPETRPHELDRDHPYAKRG